MRHVATQALLIVVGLAGACRPSLGQSTGAADDLVRRVVAALGANIGEGGMGAAYRTTDTKLNREIAIKLLPSVFAEDIEPMARFEGEAQVMASLNHPNVAAIYRVEQNAIVMELVQGENLKGPVPVDTAFEYARQTSMS